MLPFTADAPPTASAMVVVKRPIHGSELGTLKRGPRVRRKKKLMPARYLSWSGLGGQLFSSNNSEQETEGYQETKRAKKKKEVA